MGRSLVSPKRAHTTNHVEGERAGGEGGIRTHGGSSPHRFSRAAPSTTRTPLRRGVYQAGIAHGHRAASPAASRAAPKPIIDLQVEPWWSGRRSRAAMSGLTRVQRDVGDRGGGSAGGGQPPSSSLF